MIKGQVIGGQIGKVLIRKKTESSVELGELLIVESKRAKILLQVYDLIYGSQISDQNLELIAGMKLESETEITFLDSELRNYTLILAKPVAQIMGNNVRLCKELPRFFSEVRAVQKDDLEFFEADKKGLFLGNLRSGSKTMEVPVNLPGKKVLSHHILIPATTGRGKSNLVKVMLKGLMEKEYCGALVLDPHDEYHEALPEGKYYTVKNPPPGARSLKINLGMLRPGHFTGFSDPQR